jgi:hypothetical protein
MYLRIAIALMGVVPIIVLIMLVRRKNRDGKWQWHKTISGDPTMRRYENGRWEYREMTESESQEYQSHNAW